jgi:hypothetical protein
MTNQRIKERFAAAICSAETETMLAAYGSKLQDGSPTHGGLEPFYTIMAQTRDDGSQEAYVVYRDKETIATFPINDSPSDAMGYANRFVSALTRRDVASRVRRFKKTR